MMKDTLMASMQSAGCALEEVPVMYVEMDADGVITYANRAARDLHGQEEGMIGHSAWDKMPAEQRKSSEEEYRELLRSGAAPTVIRRTMYGISGYRTLEVHRSFMRDNHERIVGIRSVSIDVTEAVLAQEDAQKARIWMESILSSVSEAILVTDSLGFVRKANPAAEELFKWKASELIGQILERKIPVLEYTSTEGMKLRFQMALHCRAKGKAKVLNRIREEIWVDVSASPIVDLEKGYTEGVVSLWRPAEQPCK